MAFRAVDVASGKVFYIGQYQAEVIKCFDDWSAVDHPVVRLFSQGEYALHGTGIETRIVRVESVEEKLNGLVAYRINDGSNFISTVNQQELRKIK